MTVAERAVGDDGHLVLFAPRNDRIFDGAFLDMIEHLVAGDLALTGDHQRLLKVVCINHEVGNVSLDDRCRGLNDGLKPSGGGTEVVAVTPDPADITRRTEAYLSAHPDVQAVFAMGASAANPLIPMFRQKELFKKYKLYTFDISPEVLDSIIAGEMGFGMDAQQYLMGYLPVIYMVENATHGFWPINDSYTGPLFIDTPAKAQAMLGLAKDGIR